jgi:hypothetical protein
MTRREIYQALGEGKIMVDKNGIEVTSESNKHKILFVYPGDWSIKKKPKRYCRFKRAIDKERGEVSSEFILLGSIEYQVYITNGWTPCPSKTFEEME